jgi:hypothetical protein
VPLKPNDPFYGEFTTCAFATGAATDADALPVATATTNGADDAAFVLTVAKIDTGRYKITGTVPSGYTSGSQVQVSVAATVGGVAGKAVIASFVVDAKRVADLNDSPYNGGAVASVTGSVGSVAGNVIGSVASVTAAITLPVAPTDWLTAAAVKADAVTKLQAGLATPTNITSASGVVLAAATHTGAVIPTVSSVTAIATNGISAAAIAANAITSAKIASNAIGALQLAADAVTEIQTGLATSTAVAAIGIPPSAAMIRADLDANSTRLGFLTGDVYARIGAPVGSSISADIQTRSDFDPAADPVLLTDKTGFTLAATGLDAISITPPAGVAATFPQMLVQTWRRFFKLVARNQDNILTYGDDGTTILTSQAISDDGVGNEVQGEALNGSGAISG